MPGMLVAGAGTDILVAWEKDQEICRDLALSCQSNAGKPYLLVMWERIRPSYAKPGFPSLCYLHTNGISNSEIEIFHLYGSFLGVLVIFCCITNHPQTEWLTTVLLFFMYLWIRNSDRAFRAFLATTELQGIICASKREGLLPGLKSFCWLCVLVMLRHEADR